MVGGEFIQSRSVKRRIGEKLEKNWGRIGEELEKNAVGAND
jgi:hypothetical protein